MKDKYNVLVKRVWLWSVQSPNVTKNPRYISRYVISGEEEQTCLSEQTNLLTNKVIKYLIPSLARSLIHSLTHTFNGVQYFARI